MIQSLYGDLAAKYEELINVFQSIDLNATIQIIQIHFAFLRKYLDFSHANPNPNTSCIG